MCQANWLSRTSGDAILPEGQGMQGRNGPKLPQQDVAGSSQGFALTSLTEPAITHHRKCGRAS